MRRLKSFSHTTRGNGEVKTLVSWISLRENAGSSRRTRKSAPVMTLTTVVDDDLSISARQCGRMELGVLLDPFDEVVGQRARLAYFAIRKMSFPFP
jgi:hypothetical protein